MSIFSEQGTFLGSSVDPPSSREKDSGAVSKNDSQKTICTDLTKREICFKENGLSTTRRSSDSMRDETDFGGEDVSLHTENKLSGTGLKFDTKTSSIGSSDKNPLLQNIKIKEKSSVVKSTSLHSADLKDNANKSETCKEKDELDLNTHLSTVETVQMTTENVVGDLEEEDDECMQHDEIQNPMNTSERHAEHSNTFVKSASQEDNDIADNPYQNDVVDKDKSETGGKESQEGDSTTETIIQGLVSSDLNLTIMVKI